ncbi:MAG: ShlB/FhaC/HecB family hemolysin secretion/activation protein [Alphaproteobacteria bacterium]|nr:ShlB/FhaC/HecB family hemolysin secretion/activation protein [Alphaproteobacteria bacterium]
MQTPPQPLQRSAPAPVEPGVIPGPAGPGTTTAPAGAERVPVTPTAITVEGNTVYSPADLDPLIKPLIGKTVTAADIFALAGAIQRKYRDDGYFLATVVVPPQRVTDGRIRLRAYEGSIANVVVEGDVGPVIEQARAYLNKIGRGGQAINLRDIERYLLLTEDIPGIKTKALLRPGKQPGEAELAIELSRKWWDAFYALDNRGSRFTGPLQSFLLGGVNSFTSMGERVEVMQFTTFSSESNYVQVNGSFLVGSEGARIRAWVAKGFVHPSGPIAAIGYAGNLTLFGIGGMYPIIRSRQTNLSVNGQFEYYRSVVDSNVGRLNATDLRILRFGSDGSYRDDLNGTNTGAIRFSKGLGILGASQPGDPLMARAGSDPGFFKVQAEIARRQHIWADNNLALGVVGSLSGQLTGDVLPASEKFFLGGDRFGRGYYYGEVSGDRGFAASIELQLNVLVPPGGVGWSTPSSDLDLGRALPLQFYAFFDYGRVWNLLASEVPAITARSVGVGVRASVLEHVTIEIEAARRLDLGVDGAAAARLDPWAAFFKVTARF